MDELGTLYRAQIRQLSFLICRLGFAGEGAGSDVSKFWAGVENYAYVK